MTTSKQQWYGKTRGGHFGQWFLLQILQRIKVTALYPMLYISVPFYMLFGRKGYRAIYSYFRNRHKLGPWKSFTATCRNYLIFGKVVLDKFALLAGSSDQFSVEVDNLEYFNTLLQSDKGFVMVSAHVGNFELVGHCLYQDQKEVSCIVYDGESKTLNQRRERALHNSHINLIPVKNDMSHLFTIKESLDQGNIVTIPCDRLLGSSKSLTVDFLNGKATFPLGTFLLAVRLKVPVLALFIIKESRQHYHGYLYPLTFKADAVTTLAKAQCLCVQYVSVLEQTLRRYPEQWFNYYDFWNSSVE